MARQVTTIRFSQREVTMLEAAAAYQDVTRSEFIRAIALSEARAVLLRELEAEKRARVRRRIEEDHLSRSRTCGSPA